MYTVHDLIRELRISRQTLYRWRKAGVLPPPVIVGHSLRWRESDIATWFAYLAERARIEQAGGNPNAADGPAPPVLSTGEALFDPRVETARRAEAARRQRSEEIRRGRNQTTAEA